MGAEAQMVELVIEALDRDGAGLASLGRDRYRVHGTLPGERVRVREVRRRRRRVEGQVVEVLQPAPQRVEAPCPHYGPCGGCSLQHLAYDGQLAFKGRQVQEALARAGVEGPIAPVLGMEEPWGYRNKLELTFGRASDGTPFLGFHRRGRWQEVVPARGCLLAPGGLLAAVPIVERWAAAQGLEPYDPRTHAGFLRALILREGRATGQRMVALVTSPAPELPDQEGLVAALRQGVAGLASLLWVVDDSPSDALTVSQVHRLWGKEAIEEELGGRRYRIGVESFFQTNTQQAERLLATALALAEPGPADRVLDLFCGVGTFSLPLAERAAQVIGIEWVEEAVEHARRLAREAGLTNVRFLAGPVRLLLPEAVAQLGGVELILLDLSRSGAGGKVMRKIGRARPQRVVYVSCNPQTLGDDLTHLLPFGYRVSQVQPLDLFPHTPHVETVVRLDRIEAAG